MVNDRQPVFKVGERVFAQIYNCWGTVVKVEWQNDIEPESFIYFVELDGKDLKPRGFGEECLKR
jgi:hypothetical protein